MVNIRLRRGIGGMRAGLVISPKVAEIELTGIAVPAALTRLKGLTGTGVAAEPGVGVAMGSSEICPVRATGAIVPDIPYRTCGA